MVIRYDLLIPDCDRDVDMESVIDRCIYVLEAALIKHEKSNEAQGLLHAIELLEGIKKGDDV